MSPKSQPKPTTTKEQTVNEQPTKTLAQLEAEAKTLKEQIEAQRAIEEQAKRQREEEARKKEAEAAKLAAIEVRRAILTPIADALTAAGIPTKPLGGEYRALYCAGTGARTDNEVHLDPEVTGSTWRRTQTGRWIVTVGRSYSGGARTVRYPPNKEGKHSVGKIVALVTERYKEEMRLHALRKEAEKKSQSAEDFARSVRVECGLEPEDHLITGAYRSDYGMVRSYSAPEGHVYVHLKTMTANPAQAKILVDALRAYREAATPPATTTPEKEQQ